MFSPATIYNLHFLPVLEKKNLTDAEFAEIVRQNIATMLKVRIAVILLYVAVRTYKFMQWWFQVEISSFSNSDLLEWEKRYNAEQQTVRVVQRPSTSSASQSNPEIHRMALQVREVLPDVPYDVAYRDLCKF